VKDHIHTHRVLMFSNYITSAFCNDSINCVEQCT